MAEDKVPGMAEAVEARRVARGLSPGQFAREAGLTAQGLVPVRRGERREYHDKVRVGVARALHWPLDWYDRIRDGQDGLLLPDTDHADKPQSDVERITALEHRLGRIETAVTELTDELRQRDP